MTRDIKTEHEITRQWLGNLLALMIDDEDTPDELTFWKTTIDTGYGTYALTLSHVDGQKFELKTAQSYKDVVE